MLPLRVYIEDTDFNGIVYHANFVKYFERARTEHLRQAGFEKTTLKAQEGIAFVIRDLSISYKRPLYLDDKILISSRLVKASPMRLEFEQEIFREGAERPCAAAKVTIVVVGQDGRPKAASADVHTKLQNQPVLEICDKIW